MNVNSITGGSYTRQVSGTGTDKAHQAPPPPPPGGKPPDAGGFISAISDALGSLGVTDVAASDKEEAASALGSFLQELMASLHEQGAANGAGPGRLAEDLQNLATSESPSLEASLSSLLESLGVENSDGGTKLANFLQALADKLPESGSSGNLINTIA